MAAGRINDAVGACSGEFNTPSMTPRHHERTGCMINALWPLYAAHNIGRLNRGQSRATVLASYLEGEFATVAGCRLPDPDATAPVPVAPAPTATYSAAASTHQVPATLYPSTAPSMYTPDRAPREAPPSPPNQPHATPEPATPTRDAVGEPFPLDAPRSRQGAHAASNISRYYQPARQFGGAETESLFRAQAEFFDMCDVFQIPPSLHGACFPFDLRASDQKSPALVLENVARTAEALWEMINLRVTTTAREVHLKVDWYSATLLDEPNPPGVTPVTRFERVVSRLALLQSQLPPHYQTATRLTEKAVQAIQGEWFAATVMPTAAGDAAHPGGPHQAHAGSRAPPSHHPHARAQRRLPRCGRGHRGRGRDRGLYGYHHGG